MSQMPLSLLIDENIRANLADYRFHSRSMNPTAWLNLAIQYQNGGWTLIGLLSNGAKSCFKGLPEVYTKVGDYLDWIHTTISENSPHNIQVYP